MMNGGNKLLEEYEIKYKTESIILRDELLLRLPKNFVHPLMYEDSYENPVSLFDCEDVADDIGQLAGSL